MKFLIFAYIPHWDSGGCNVLHELSKLLSDLGEDVYLAITETKLPENPAKLLSIEEAIQLAAQDDCVTIYPEVESGNPLNAKNIVRWVLYYPQGHGGKGDKVYHPSEFVFTYHEKYVANTPHENSPVLRIFQSRVDKFYPMGKERIYDAVLVRKSKYENVQEIANKHFEPYLNIVNKKIILFDDVLNTVSGYEQLNEILNEIRYFVSFDRVTYHSVFAALSGCISVVTPADGMTAEQWKQSINTHSHGVAYGFDDLHWAMISQHKTKEHLLNIEEKNIMYTKNMIKLIKEKWNL